MKEEDEYHAEILIPCLEHALAHKHFTEEQEVGLSGSHPDFW